MMKLFRFLRPAREYNSADICSVSISCGHMDFSYSYSFYLRKKECGWLLDAEYATDSENPRTEFEMQQVSENDVNGILSIAISESARLSRYKKPKIKVLVLDETKYRTAVGFSDGEVIAAPICVNESLTECFFALAEKYRGCQTIMK